MERLTYRDAEGRALLTSYGKQMYCSTQATADCICELEERSSSMVVWTVWWANQGDTPEITVFAEEEIARECYEYYKTRYDECQIDMYYLYPQKAKPRRWEFYGEDYKDAKGVTHNYRQCGNCGFIHEFLDGHFAQYQYCPQCGERKAVAWE